MSSLFWKGMLAFLVVIIVAVGTVALIAGRATETEFRRYAFSKGGLWERQVEELAAYYARNHTWLGVQTTISSRHRGRHRSEEGTPESLPGYGPPELAFRLLDAEGNVIGDTEKRPQGSVRPEEQETILPIVVDGETVGYLLPYPHALDAATLDPRQTQFLARVRSAILIAALTATAVALLVGGLLFRSIVAPLRQLTAASQAIAAGDLSVRAPVQGGDEISRLAAAFNRMAESLARAETARRNQTADIAHELRTPLTVLRGTLEAMLDGIYPTDRENLQAALVQVQTLARLVDDLRLLALADAGQLVLHPAPLDIVAFLRETVEAHRLTAQERGVTLEVETPVSLPPVSADRDRLAQVMGNLLSNGLRYVPAGGRVVVRAAMVEDTGDEVVITVADNGPGIPADDLPHIFDRFWRGDKARRRATGGSGLGLAIVRSLVEAHGGRIWAESVEGKGTAFSFTLRVVSDGI